MPSIALRSLVLFALFTAAPLAWGQVDFTRCIDSLRQELPRHPQVRADTFATHTRTAQDLRPSIDTAARSQPEFQLPVWDYLAKLVDAKRVLDGSEVLRRESAAVARVAAQYRIDPATVVAVLGLESDFGRLQGGFPVVDATLSRACLKLSDKERKAHFFAALWLLQQGLVQPDAFVGSWAGAFGMTQFMPGSHVRYMVDGDGDGAIDTIHNMADALATAANYLKSLGWVEGLPWGIEVSAPRDIMRQWSSSEREHACLGMSEAQSRCRRLDAWAALGLVRADGQSLTSLRDAWPVLSSGTPMALLTPAGPNGPAWLVSRNFQVVWQYNHADAYALAVGLLSSALRDEPPVRAAWPVSEARMALSRTGLAALQTLLAQTGHCDLASDGYDGPATRQAVREEERRRGVPESGRPTTALLELMRAEPLVNPEACPVNPTPAPAAPDAVRAPTTMQPTDPPENPL